MNPGIKPSEKKDHFLLTINNITIGEFERSQLRHLIEVIDNGIGSGLRTQIKPEVLEYQKMLAEAKEAALNASEGDDCLMCGS